MMSESFDCMIISVIKTTLAICNYTLCSDECMEYLLNVGNNCPVVFHNEVYLELWQTLIHQCIQGH